MVKTFLALAVFMGATSASAYALPERCGDVADTCENVWLCGGLISFQYISGSTYEYLCEYPLGGPGTMGCPHEGQCQM